MIFNFKRKNKQDDFHEMADHELITAYRREGNPEVISQLFIRYSHLVYGICLKYLDNKDEAKDAVMDIFEGLMEDIKDHEIRNFKNWLFSVSRNHCLMILRKKKIFLLSNDPDKENIEGLNMEFADEIHQDVLRQDYTMNELLSALNELRAEQRKCLELVYLEEKSYQEVSDLTGYTLHEVKSYVQNGKRNLKIKLKSMNEEEN